MHSFVACLKAARSFDHTAFTFGGEAYSVFLTTTAVLLRARRPAGRSNNGFATACEGEVVRDTGRGTSNEPYTHHMICTLLLTASICYLV